jgi:hypothetical protein
MNLKLHLKAVFDDMRECAVQIRDEGRHFFANSPFCRRRLALVMVARFM